MSDKINNTRPKVLIINRLTWNDNSSSNTLTNLWSNYGADYLAHIYIETKNPDTVCCHNFFQISEYSLIKKLWKWRTKTGKKIEGKIDIIENSTNAQKEDSIMSYVRQHRSFFYTYLREVLWFFNGWKSKELRNFIKGFDPDIVWMDGSPLILMNRLAIYILKIAKKPSIVFLQDDAYTYKSCSKTPSSLLYKMIIRHYIKKTVKMSRKVFVCSPKMKEEYDSLFNVNSIFIAKGADMKECKHNNLTVHNPVRIVYLGNTLLGRIYSLIEVSKAIEKINSNGIKAQLYVYSSSFVPDDLKTALVKDNSSFLMDPIPFNLVNEVIDKSDILLFVESLEEKSKNIARLSFSTKIGDYLTSGKCVFAIGGKDIAPIEYFTKEDAAVIATSKNSIEEQITKLLNSPELITEYAQKAFDCAKRNHDINAVYGLILSNLQQCLISNSKE